MRPVHDATLIEAPADEIDEHALMEKASAVVLGGFKLRSDVKTMRSQTDIWTQSGFGTRS